MQIILNGKLYRLDGGSTLQQLVDQQGLSRQRIAIEVNHSIIPRSQFTVYRLCRDDQVEIVHAVGGG